jgi:glycosyltransferase involved in cell wall biosynthesis
LEVLRIPLDKSDWIGFGYKAAQKMKNLESFDVVHFWDVHFGWAYRRKYIGSLQHSFQQRINSLGSFSPRNDLSWLVRYTYYTLSKRFAEIPSINRAEGLLAGSRTSRDEFIKDYGIQPEKIRLARHGVDTDFFEPKKDTRSWREKFGINLDEPVILFAGFITPRKGLEYLAQAMPNIHPRPKLLIIGRWRSNSYRNRIMDLLQPIKEHVIELGFVDDQDMPYYFSMSDVYVSSSLLEGFGLPIAEALACGTPVVAADSGSVAEVMGPGGILVGQRDPQGLANGISKLLRNSSLRRELGTLGREYVVNEFSLDSMVQATLNAYEYFE